MNRDLVPVLRRQRFNRLDDAVYQWRKSEGFEMKLHSPCLDRLRPSNPSSALGPLLIR
jgi:hypothetical protein